MIDATGRALGPKQHSQVDAVVAYAPAHKLAIEGDIATAAYDYQFWPDNFRDLIDYYRLEVESIARAFSLA